ncbi:Wadjet anti-phage system protein JetA family protein [Mesorhizobium sp.]|uniref:Wadjet anti-phage system protein JetA family protein n=1 Tax=Mesorhizobium sp. TaxID=1871066 RepID=UPI00257C1CBB|nr:Wadjet anti-phage system protein JetA family protein [Mesorhizobium sp.]
MANFAVSSISDASRPQLFGQLGPDIFTVFSGGNRLLYERAILAVYDDFYRSDLLFPTEAEVVGVIYNCITREPSLWAEDEAAVDLDRLVTRTGRRVRRRRVVGVDNQATGTAISRSRHIYNRMLQTGWLDEASYGLKTTVEMPSGAIRLAEFLCTLKEGGAEQLGGLVVEVRNAIRAVREKPAENALGLNKAAQDSARFGRYLRSVLAALREVDRQVLASDTLAERLRHYFEDFVERVLLRDYTSISTTAHPYRHRRTILASLDELEDSEIDLAAVADAYLEARLVPDGQAARDLVQEDLFRIRRVFERIEESFEAIQQHRSRLETRLRNVVRYAGRRTNFLQRSEHVIQGLDDALSRGVDDLTVRGLIEPRIIVVAPELLAKPRGARPEIADADLALPPLDPLREFRRQLEREYLDRLTISPAKVSRFLERRVPPFGETTAAYMRIETVDDFLAFEAIRVIVAGGLGADADSRLAKTLKGRFEFVVSADAVSNEWLDCGGFHVKRLDDSITLEVGHAI